jgi:hypothetical protein
MKRRLIPLPPEPEIPEWTGFACAVTALVLQVVLLLVVVGMYMSAGQYGWFFWWGVCLFLPNGLWGHSYLVNCVCLSTLVLVWLELGRGIQGRGQRRLARVTICLTPILTTALGMVAVLTLLQFQTRVREGARAMHQQAREQIVRSEEYLAFVRERGMTKGMIEDAESSVKHWRRRLAESEMILGEFGILEEH